MAERKSGFRVNDGHVDSMQLDGEAVLLNLDNHSYFGLNQTATEIWSLVCESPGITSGQVADQLGKRYGKQNSRISADVEVFLDALAGEGLLNPCPSETDPTSQLERAELPYNVPRLEPFGELNSLILSGE